jgi:hypothetical protein
MNLIEFSLYRLKKLETMKNVTSLFILSIMIIGGFWQSTAQVSPKKVQVAILFDTSNSMDGLINQAKNRIWGIVNEVNSLRYRGQTPKIEIALYEYGKSTLSEKDNYIRKILNLSSDLDVVSQQLFGLTTNGGLEYCGAVIKQSLDELEWSNDPTDLKLVYIAGNESFTQGPVDFREVCATAKQKGIVINTIYCGDYKQGVIESWKEGAECSNGSYFNIDSDAKIVHIDTPYDKKIDQYNDSLNTTYFGYGVHGKNKKELQTLQDVNAESQSMDSKSQRTMAKASLNYSNSSWDIVDAVNEKEVDITKMEENQLPEELKGKTDAEKIKFIEVKNSEREKYQKEIQNLASERQKFIDQEMKKRSENGVKDDFGTSVNESIRKTALNAGYNVEKK